MKIKSYNIFQRYSTTSLLLVGSLITLVFSYLGYVFKGRFDGFLDLHFVDQIFWYDPFVDNLINIGIGTVLLFCLGKLLNPKTRIIDILSAVMASRIFLYINLFANYDGFISEKTNRIIENFPVIDYSFDFFALVIFGIISLAFLLLYIMTLYLGFKVAVNSKSWWHILYFILTILLIEFTTKFIFYQFSL